MRKSLFFLAILLCFSCFLSSFFTAKSEVFASENFKILVFGDSISAGYAPDVSPYNDTEETQQNDLLDKRKMLMDYKDYCNDGYAVSASESTYSYLFAKSISNNFVIKSYANSGDDSNDLASILTSQNYTKSIADSNNNYLITNDALVEEIKSADIITLSIGANDILRLIRENIFALINNPSALVSGLDTTELQTYNRALNQKVSTFETNYKSVILPALNRGAKIFVMTIYNPYMYSGEFGNFIGFNQILEYSKNALNKINQIIKNNANENIIVVDVEEKFSSISEDEYKNYVNIDASQIRIEDIANLENGIPYYLDPHPTPLGQKTIADMYVETYNANIKMSTSSIIIIVTFATLLTFSFIVAVYLIIQKIKFKAIKF